MNRWSRGVFFYTLLLHYLEFLIRTRKTFIAALLGTILLMFLLPYSIVINQVNRVQGSIPLTHSVEGVIKSVILVLDPLMVSLIGSAILMQVVNEERIKKILEYIVAFSPLSIKEIVIIKGFATAIILFIIALVCIFTQLMWLYATLALVVNLPFLCLLIMSTLVLTLGLTFLSTTIPLLVSSRYVQILTLAIVATINLVFFIFLREVSTTFKTSSMEVLAYNYAYIMLGLAMTLLITLLVKHGEDRIAMNVITSD